VLRRGGGRAAQKERRENILLMAFSLLYAVFFALLSQRTALHNTRADRGRTTEKVVRDERFEIRSDAHKECV